MALPDGTTVTIANVAVHPSIEAPMGRMVTFTIAVPDQDTFNHSAFVPLTVINPVDPSTGQPLTELDDIQIVNAAWAMSGGDIERRANSLVSSLIGQPFTPPA